MKAFVGHSFAEKDKSFVDAILRFLYQSGVLWDDGLPPAKDPSISKKIRKRIDDNDIFIGIFTKDEAIHQIDSRRWHERWRSQLSSTQRFTTSNWVIQESGYALGKGKKLILLVERSIDKFPALDGDAEIIPFTTGDLSSTLLKLSAVIQVIKSAPVAGETTQPSAPPEGKPKQQEDDRVRERGAVPEPWETDFMKVFEAYQKGEIAQAETLYNEKVKSHLPAEKVTRWDAVILRWKYCAGDSSALKTLEEYAQQHNTPDVLRQLAISYSFTNKHQDAADVFSKCLNLDTDVAEKVDFLGQVAISYANDKQHERAIDTLLEAAVKTEYKDHLDEIFKNLVKIAEMMNDDYLFAVFAEQALEVNPVNTGLRFSLAHKYSKQERNDLALSHYKRALSIQEYSGTLNNLGVAYSELGMKAMAVSSYKRAVEKESTLAAANLAYRYLNEGFSDQAVELLTKADALSAKGIKVDGNVGEAKNKLKSLLEDEETKERNILEAAKEARQFRIRHAKAYCTPVGRGKTADISGTWHLDKWGDILFVVNNDTGTFEAVLETEQEIEPGALSQFLAPGGLLAQHPPGKKHKTRRVHLTGQIKNCAGQYKIRVTDSAGRTTLLASPDAVYDAEGLLIIDQANNQISTMEDGKKRVFAVWNKA